MNVRYQVLLLELARHAGSYVELGAAAAGDYRRALERRSLLLLGGVITAVAGLMALWSTGLVALWDSPWRTAYAVVTTFLLLVGAAWALYSAVVPRVAGPSAGLLREELHKDMELFQQWKSTL